VEELVHDEFDRSYKWQDPCEDSNTIDSTQVCGLFNVVVCSANLQQASFPRPQNVFDDLPSLRASHGNECCDDLTRYLATDLEAVDDVLLW